jgi:hypothetical protein
MPTQLTGSLDLTPLPLDATEAQRNEKVNTILKLARPLANISGINGVKVHLADANLVIEVDPTGADDAGGATTNDSGKVDQPNGGGTTGGGTVDPTDPGETFTPGDANTPGAAVAYESRLRGGTASLIGWSEWTSPSTPAKKYRKYAISGFTGERTYTSCGGTLVQTNVGTYSGAATVNVTTGTLTDATRQVLTQDGVVTSDTVAGTPGYTSSVPSSTAKYTRTATSTTLTTSGTETCVNQPPAVVAYGTTTEVFSIEDTDLDATTRLLAGSTWGSWGTAASFPAASASYAARTTGFTFTYEQTQLRANYTGMPAGWPFKVKVRIASVNVATSAVSTVKTLNFTPTADGTGAATWSVDVVPASPGFTYRVQSVSHFL